VRSQSEQHQTTSCERLQLLRRAASSCSALSAAWQLLSCLFGSKRGSCISLAAFFYSDVAAALMGLQRRWSLTIGVGERCVAASVCRYHVVCRKDRANCGCSL
jgi:hypothetical protein